MDTTTGLAAAAGDVLLALLATYGAGAGGDWSPLIGLTDGGKDLAQRSLLLLKWRRLVLLVLALFTLLPAESPMRKNAAVALAPAPAAAAPAAPPPAAAVGKARFSTSCVLGVL